MAEQDSLRRYEALSDVAIAACDSILALAETSEQHYTCGEFVAIEALFTAAGGHYGPGSHGLHMIRAWHASGDCDPEDCSHAWYVALQADSHAPEPINDTPSPMWTDSGKPIPFPNGASS